MYAKAITVDPAKPIAMRSSQIGASGENTKMMYRVARTVGATIKKATMHTRQTITATPK